MSTNYADFVPDLVQYLKDTQGLELEKALALVRKDKKQMFPRFIRVIGFLLSQPAVIFSFPVLVLALTENGNTFAAEVAEKLLAEEVQQEGGSS